MCNVGRIKIQLANILNQLYLATMFKNANKATPGIE